MRKLSVILVLVFLIMSTSSWAAAGKLSAGGLVTVGGTMLFGGLARYGVLDNLDIEGRLELAFVSGATVTLLDALGIYNFDIGNKQLVPFVGGGLSVMSATVSVPGWGSVGGSAFGFVGLGGVNFYLSDQVAILADVEFSTAGGASGIALSVGSTYTF